MSPLPPDTARATAALAYLCEHLAEISGTLGDDGTDTSTPLQQLLGAVRSSRSVDIAPALHAVHTALRVAGDAPGIFGHTRSLEALGVHSFEVVYRCPLQVCVGRGDAGTGAEPPRCAVSGQPLRRERLA
ncbi:hypothetical protein [Nocardia carnea]|uniref:hypothetical protein n=1 Tax=Nocardia carnea TaxID=37328 RepID=UPI00245536F8|nr:hypothetical protein [Nocardia carnea]